MILIVAHHYVVNSALLVEGGPILSAPTAPASLFLLILGAFGKTGINCFVLITGYFMCTSSISAKKFAKLYLEVLFYRVVIFCIFWLSGYTAFSLNEFLHCLFPINTIRTSFTPAFLVFFLCIPFLNILVRNMTQKMHAYLLLLLFFVFVIMGTVTVFFELNMNYLSWFIVLFLFSSYIRLYPNKLFDNVRVWSICSIVFVSLSVVSVVACTWLGTVLGLNLSYYFVTDSNTFLAFATGLSAFMFFKNVRIPYSKTINTIAACCFGVLLIHANSDTMRQWLWIDLLDNAGKYASPWMPLYAVGTILAVYLICTGIDLLRIRFLEKPFFVLWDKHWPQISAWFQTRSSALLRRLNISDT